MKLKSLELENIRSYDETSVEFPEGTILLHGENGAGKTTLLMGIFSGLFLSDIRNVEDFNLDEFVRRGEDKGVVKLTFEIDGEEYEVTWEHYTTNTASEATLTSPSLSEPVTGIKDVKKEVRRLLNMDADDFTNSTYVRQGEIDKLIDSGNRAEMIDGLLGLDELDKYIERMKNARQGASAVKSDSKSKRESYVEELKGFDRDESGFQQEIQEISDEISQEETELDEIKDYLEELKEARNDLENDIKEYDGKKEKKDSKEEKIDELKDEKEEKQNQISESEENIQRAKSEIDSISSDIEELSDEVGYEVSTEEEAEQAQEKIQDEFLNANEEKSNKENEYENAQDDLKETKEELSEKREEISNLEEELDEKQGEVSEIQESLEEARNSFSEKIAQLQGSSHLLDIEPSEENLERLRDEHIDSKKSEIEEEINNVTGDIRELQAKRDGCSEDIEEIRELEDEGKCPKCGQKVDESHVEDEIQELEEEISELEGEIEEKKEKKEELEDTKSSLDQIKSDVIEAINYRKEEVQDRKDRKDSLNEEIDGIREEIEEAEGGIEELKEDKQSLEEELSERKDEFEQAQQEVDEIQEAKEVVGECLSKYEEIDEHEDVIDSEQQNIQHYNDTIDSLNEQISELQDEVEELEDELGGEDIEELREDLGRVEEKIEDKKEERESRQNELQELRSKRTGLKKDLESYQNLQDKADLWERKEKWASEVYGEINSTISIYEEVKSELREKYLAYINRFTNDIFKKIYRNSSYQQVIIDEEEEDGEYDYTIELLTDDGTTEDPSNASGGERAIVNLALRAGIYRLIAKREGGERSRLPPFILDEPTTFLDANHVGQLEEMLDEIEKWDVPQVIVVSHDENLIHGADHECAVTKEKATDTSKVELREAGEA